MPFSSISVRSTTLTATGILSSLVGARIGVMTMTGISSGALLSAAPAPAESNKAPAASISKPRREYRNIVKERIMPPTLAIPSKSDGESLEF
jgi:hypothetical protein